MEKKPKRAKSHLAPKDKLQFAKFQVERILESVSDSFVALDTNWIYTYVNEKAAQTFGRTREQLIGKHIWTEFPEGVGQPFYKAYYKAVETGQPVFLEEYYPPYDRWFENRIYPSKDGLSIFFHDITERKKIEMEIRRERDLNARTMETSPIGITLVDADGKITFANNRAQKILGLSKDDIQQRDYNTPSWRITDFNGHPFPDEQLPFRLVAETKKPARDVQHAIEWPDGRRILLSINAAPLFSNGGKFDGMVATFDDITHRTRTDLLLALESRIFQKISSGASLQDILNETVLIIEALSRETIASILLLDPDGVHVRYGAAPHLPPQYNDAIEGAGIGPSEGSCGTAMYLRKQVVVTDIETDPLWDNYRELARTHGLRACWSTPVIGSDGSTLASFAMYYREPRSPSAEDFELIERVTHLVQAAIESKQVQEKLRQSEERFFKAFHEAPIGMTISDLKQGVIIDANQTYAEILGFTREEIIGHTATELGVMPESPLRALLAKELSERGVIREREYRLHRRDGDFRDVSANMQVITIGEAQFMLALLTDITESKRAERERDLLDRVGRIVENELDLATILRRVVESTKETFNYSHVSLYLLSGERLVLQHQVGYSQVVEEIPLTQGIAGRVARTGQPVFLEDVRSDPAYFTAIEGIVSEICVPIFDEGKVIGIFNVESAQETRLTESDLKLMMALIQGISPAIGRARIYTQLRDSEQKFSVLFEKSAFVAALSKLPEGVLVMVNEAFEKTVGFTREEALGRTSQELGFNPDAEGRARILALLNASGSVRNAELPLHTKSGEEREFSVNIDLVDIGDQKFILNTMQDITERKRAEQELRENEEKFITLFKAAPGSIILSSLPDGKTVEVNDNFSLITGYSAEEALGKTTADLGMWADPQVRERFLAMLQRDGFVRDFEADLNHKSGDIRNGLVSGFIVTIQNKKHLLGTFYDITERKRAEEEVRLSRDRLGELSRRLLETHETVQRAIGRELHDQIGQMLTALKLTIEIAMQLPPEQALQKAAQGKGIVNELLNRVSRLSLELRPPMLDDLGLIPALLWHINRYHEQTNIAVDFKHSGAEGKRFDNKIETTVYRIAQESLTNVARHAQATRVRLEVHVISGWMEIQIEDNGQGFDPKIALAKNRGLGGMRERAQLVGGTFQIESEKGKGTRKLIRLPLREEIA